MGSGHTAPVIDVALFLTGQQQELAAVKAQNAYLRTIVEQQQRQDEAQRAQNAALAAQNEYLRTVVEQQQAAVAARLERMEAASSTATLAER